MSSGKVGFSGIKLIVLLFTTSPSKEILFTKAFRIVLFPDPFSPTNKVILLLIVIL